MSLLIVLWIRKQSFELFQRAVGFKIFPFLFAMLAAKLVDLSFQLARAEPHRALPHDDQLFHTVGGRNCDLELIGELMRGFFDVGIGCLRGLCVDDVQVVQLLNRTGIILDLIRVEYQNQNSGAGSLEAGTQLDQLIAGCGQIFLSQGNKLTPRMNHIVTIN